MAKTKEKAKPTVGPRMVVAIVTETKPGETCFCVRDPEKLKAFGATFTVGSQPKVSVDQVSYGKTKRFLGTIADLHSDTNFSIAWDDEAPARMQVGSPTEVHKAS